MATPADMIEKWSATRVRHQHRHAPVRNVNKMHAEALSPGDRVADGFAATVGSWRFIIIQTVLLAIWMVFNAAAWFEHWDPYPFILLNLVLSFQAAYAAPIIMMSQNRQSAKDRIAAEHDYEINVKAEDELKAVMRHLEQQDEFMIDLLQRLEQQHQDLLARTATLLPGGAKPS